VVDPRAIHYHGAHAYQNAAAQGAAVQDRPMADGHVVADGQRIAVGIEVAGMGDMQHAAVLHADPLPDAYTVHVAADDRHRPYRAVVVQHHIAQHHGLRIDIDPCATLRTGAPPGPDVMACAHDLPPAVTLDTGENRRLA